MSMNEHDDLQKRLKNADPAAGAPDLNATVVAKAGLRKTRQGLGFKASRLFAASGAVAVSALALSIVLPNYLAPAPLFTVADAGGETSKMSADAESSLGMVEDSMYWPGWSTYEYSAGPDLGTQNGKGNVYQSKLVGEPLSLLRSMAAIFGVDGEPVRDEWSDEKYPSYSITVGNKYLSAYWSGTGSWSYSNWSELDYSCEEPAVRSDSEEELSYCEPKLTPELIPTVDELKLLTAELMLKTGQTYNPSDLKIYRDDWGANVSLPYLSNGVDTGAWTYISWGMNGELSYFSSHSFELVDRGQFDTVSPKDAVARISDGRWFGSAPDSFYQSMDGYGEVGPRVGSEESVSKEASEPVDVISEEATPIDDQPLPIDGGELPSEEPELVRLTITSSLELSLSVWDSQGNYWLVPGYILYNDQGWFDSIIALQDGVIELPEPFEVMPYEGIREGPAESELVD